MKTYTAITIGPIYKTMLKARSAKAFWSGSYLFSYMMEFIYERVKDKNILLPRPTQATDTLQVGIFPDRIMLEGKLEDFGKIKSELIDDLAKIIANDIHKSKDEVSTYLEEYLLIRKVEKELDENTAIVKELNDLLDTTELFQYRQSNATVDYIKMFLEKKNNGYNTFIQNKFQRQPFPALNEIATRGLEHRPKDSAVEDQVEYYQKIKDSNATDYRNHHKYVAIVEADGDNFGSFISGLKDTAVIKEVSECLFNFSVQAVETIKKYSGVPIYAGGDDLLFFAPVVTNNGNIIEVTKEIDKVFQTSVLDKLGDKLKGEKMPSMSYGINISYYKSPLDQALSNAHYLLSDKAKKADGKNAIALRVTKHSGQVFELLLRKHDESINEKIETLFSETGLKSDFISGFMYKIAPLTAVIKGVGSSSNVEKRFDAFFENYFDEDGHAKSLESGFLKKVKELLIEIYKTYNFDSYPDDKKEGSDFSPRDKRNEANLNLLYAVLRFYQFIHAKPEA